MKKIDSCCPWGQQSSKTDAPARKHKDSDNHKFKPMEPKLKTAQYFNNTETSQKAWKKKKKNKRRNKQEC